MYSEYIDIDLNKVKYARISIDEPNQHGYSQEELTDWTQKVKDVQERLRSNPTYFERNDFSRYEKELRSVYKELYEPDNIKNIRVYWDKRTGEYIVDNGNHRLAAAKNAGVSHLRARVFSDDKNLLVRLKQDESNLKIRAYVPVWERNRINNTLPEIERRILR